MAFCPNFNSFSKLVRAIKQSVLIDQDKDKDLRYDVWSTTQEQVAELFQKGIAALPGGKNNSQHVITKVENALRRIKESPKSVKEFMNDIINDDENIAYSIALHELMESVKGESDKARNLGIEIAEISDSGVLPALPMSRVAASIGRKIAYQQGYRFKSDDTDPKTPAEIETLYYAIGNKALLALEKKGYVNLHDNINTIKDYIDVDEMKKEFPKVNIVSDKFHGVTLNEKKFGIKPGTPESAYFTNRTDSDITDTKLGVIADTLVAVRQITQPATITLPDLEVDGKPPTKTMEELAEGDDPNITPDKKTEKTRKKIYDTPVFVHNTVHELMSMLHAEAGKTGKSGSKIIKDTFEGHPELINSLFGLKRSDDHSIDKKESVSGQNLSKTTPLDDLVEHYGILQGGDFTSSAPLHMAMKIGRNARLYYENSVLNPHGSKQSRYMLTSGENTIASEGDDFDYLVYGISQALGDKNLTYKDFTGETKSKLDEALKTFTEFENDKTLDDKLATLSDLSILFPGVDYVSLLTTMKAVQDIRNPKGGKVTTEFNVSADATASGGTLTFLQALGTNPNVETFLQRVGLLKGGDPDNKIDDLYGIMTESIQAFVKGEKIPGMIGQDKSSGGIRALMEDTVDMLFGKEPEDVRDLSKDPTMTFVYGQGRKGAMQTMARSLADRIIDNLDDPNVRKYLVRLFDDNKYRKIDSAELKNTPKLYSDIVNQLSDVGIPGQLYDIMDAAINKQYLKDFKVRSNKVAEFVKQLPQDKPFKILPAGAKMAGESPTLASISKYGMPLTKVMEVSNPTEPGQPDTVLTRRQKLTKTVADVSPIHSIDAAQLYHSLDETMGDNGVVVVHDDIRGTVQDVRDMEEEYRDQTIKIISEYDIHQAIMNSVAAYSPEIAESADFKELMAEIQADVDVKKKIMKSSFNHDTHALIGDGLAYQEFANPAQEAATATTTKTKTKAKKKPKKSAMDKLADLAGESEIISKFILMANSSNIEFGKENEFEPGSDTIKVTKKATKENIEHEIIHANTVAHIAKAFDNPGTKEHREVLYFKKSIEQVANSNIVASDATQARIDYIMAQTNEVDQVAEFVAVMESESDTATEIYNILSKETPSPTLMKRIQAFVKKVANTFLEVSPEDLAKDIDIDKLYAALVNTVAQGETQRSQDYAEASKYLSQFKKSFGYGPQKVKGNAYDKSRGALNYANYAVATMLNSKMERRGRKLLSNVHDQLLLVAPMYVDVANKMAGIYNESEALQQMVHTITGEGTNKTKKADILAKFAEVMGQQTEVINSQMGKFHKLLAPLSDKEKKTVGRFVTEMPLHDYFVLAEEFDTVDAIASEVAKLEKSVYKKAPNVRKDINDLIAWNVKHEKSTKGRIYNLEASYPMNGSKFGEDVRKLLALKSIQTIGSKEFVKFLENTDLINLVKDSVVANRLSLLENEGASKLTDSMVPEYYKEPFQLKAIEKSELKMYEFGENTGWKVLKDPTTDELGIVYRTTIDSSSIPGAYTDTKLSSTDIDVTGKKAEYFGVVETKTGHKLRLNREQKLKLGLVEDFSQGLVRGTAHNMAIQESQVIRDELLKEDTRMVVGSNTSKLEAIVKSDNIDNPWFVKLKEGVSYSDMPASVKAKYAPVGNRASNVQNFNDEVDLVRKDISHWLLGGSSKSLFTNPKMKWATRIVKDLIAGAKIGMVVLNPAKIAQDNVSNISYLSVMGVDPLFIAKNYKQITVDYQGYADLQRQILQLKVQLTARPDSNKIKKQIKTLQNRLSRNSLGDLGQKGFINSLGSDLVARNADTLSGLQADMHSALHYLLINKEGKKNYVSHFIMQLQNLGFNGEDFLEYVGNVAQKAGSDADVKKELDQVADRLKEIRTEQDVINYVSQYTTSPSSEAVHLGSSMTDLTDVLAKETLYRHLVENEGASPEAARIKVLDSFPDYKENMPLAVKQLSDMGIIMFPSFWLRIQKVIYRLGRDKPINLATELMFEEALGSDINTIVDANIVNKSNTFGGLLHTPLEPIGVGSVLPTHLF